MRFAERDDLPGDRAVVERRRALARRSAIAGRQVRIAKDLATRRRVGRRADRSLAESGHVRKRGRAACQ